MHALVVMCKTVICGNDGSLPDIKRKCILFVLIIVIINILLNYIAIKRIADPSEDDNQLRRMKSFGRQQQL